MRKLFHEVLTVMENAFARLEKQVPPPQRVEWADGFVFRYLERSLEQALILKLARSISTLRAVDILLLHGFLQEQASLLRILDEIHEDIYFLAAPLTNDQVTERHTQYLAAFFAEEFPDPENSLARHEKPNLPPRRKIRSYVTRVLSTDPNPSKAHDVGETISSVYSGYVHASAPQTMDMYGGSPAHFHLAGMRGTPLMEDHIHDSWNYFYRGLMATTVVAKALGDAPLVKTMYDYLQRFEGESGERFNG
ncbi:hypothetical protein LNV23_23790 [Paucibacter sp. DJ1R-11]|uniref:hypothetical protein n=1 Tax=Paucibacter sp. DJ1R-11 TaxID=2893556 RepID=UPI0021E393D2|nr:hypothetical protein [Paucibacter sp. DJ1R-11]MCV2366458.1 hypothetical protein [Paucibacter sp. DJ1R-11]